VTAGKAPGVRTSRKKRLAWLVAKVGARATEVVADMTDREFARYYRFMTSLPDDHPLLARPRPAGPICRRCHQEVDVEVVYHCRCGDNAADIADDEDSADEEVEQRDGQDEQD